MKDKFGREIIYVDGYWLDDKSEFKQVKCVIGADFEPEDEDNVFFYFDSMADVESFFKKGKEEFVLTDIYFECSNCGTKQIE